MKKIIVTSVISLLASANLYAAAPANTNSASSKPAKIIIPQVKQEVTLDGKLDEAFWQSATKVDLGYETNPGENIAASVKTTAYVAENGDSLFVAFVAEDPSPEKIRASLKNRDTFWSDDMVGFKLDTFNDERKAANFFVNPLGIQMDSIEDDISGGEDISWNAIWYSEGRITENGYVVEIELPFKVLRFPDNKNVKTWGIDFVRMYPRDHQFRFAHSEVKRDVSCRVCQIAKASGLKDIESGQNIELTPYVAGGRSDSREPLVDNQWQNGDTDFDVGIDFRWGVTDNSVLSATINPDFSQVESDALQLDVNTQFALFFQEQRPFFVEGSDYFNTRFNLVHTRNIGDPDYGVKYTGKNAGHSYGVLFAHDQNTTFLTPGSQGSSLTALDNTESDNVALRYTLDIGEKSQVGAIYTERSADNYKNSVAGIDGKYQITNEDSIRYQVVQSDTKVPLELIDSETGEGTGEYISDDVGSGLGYSIGYNHRGRNWKSWINHTELDEDFRADLGFISRNGYKQDVIGLAHDWYGEPGDSITRFDIGGDIDATYDYTGQKLEEEAEIRMSFNAPYQSWVGWGGGVRDAWFSNSQTEDSQGNPITDVTCGTGCWFDQTFLWFGANFRPVSNLQVGINFNSADSVDFSQDDVDFKGYRAAKDKRYHFSLDWQAARQLQINARFNKATQKISEGKLFESDILNLSSTFQFDKESYLRFTLRYSDTEFNTDLYSHQTENVKRVGRQLLYGYKLNPRTAFFLVYSDGFTEINAQPDEKDEGRSIYAKFNYAFQL